jgi:hypothetical protein
VTLQSRGRVTWWKRKTTEHLEDYYRTLKKVFESRSIVFMVQKLLVDHKVVDHKVALL